MTIVSLLKEVPSWAAYAVMTAIVLISIYSGFLFARFRKGLNEKDEESAINTIVGATMALLAFILAFTFSVTASRFDTRRELMLNEVTAIETTFLRTSLIPEPHCSAVRALLRDYVDFRVEGMKSPEKVAQLLEQSQRLQREIWQHAAALAEADLKNPDIVSLFIDSVNEVFELHTQRVTVALINRLPLMMWRTLCLLTILSMFQVGYLFGMTGKANWPLILVFALAFSSVIMIIADLDASTGMIKVNPKPMIDLQQRINEG
jgi:hypothetical protein